MSFTDDNLNPVEQGIFDKAVDALGPLERDALFTCRKASCGRSVSKNSCGPLRYLEYLGEACCVGQIYPLAYPKLFSVRPSPTVRREPHWTGYSFCARGCRLSSIKHSGRRTSFRKKTRSRFEDAKSELDWSMGVSWASFILGH
jgi:hypothetical protein